VSRAEHRDRIRSQIIQGAMAAFERDGFDGTKVEDIAASIGIAERTIYRHFPSKVDIVYEPLLPSIRAATEFLIATPDDLSPGDALRGSILSAVDLIERDRKTLARHLELASSSPSLIATGRALTDTATNDLRRELDRRCGPNRNSVATATWAELAFVLLFGARRIWLLHPDVPLRPLVVSALEAVDEFSVIIDHF
jgi:AcrR family transcriptional regulator